MTLSHPIPRIELVLRELLWLFHDVFAGPEEPLSRTHAVTHKIDSHLLKTITWNVSK